MNVARADVVKDGSNIRSASKLLEEAPAIEKRSSDLAVTPGPEKEKLQRLLRLRTSLSFLLSSYVPGHIRDMIEKHISLSSLPIDFTPLTEHLNCISEQRARAAAAAAVNDNISRKRGRLHDEEDFDLRQGAIRLKQDEEKKKRSKESKAVRLRAQAPNLD
ncbi:hypothetical protein KEM54_005384 [Ascosphaera aggregata]|nr:hypothetical protein KEM54_005384 [Ascosphaera aggregata]